MGKQVYGVFFLVVFMSFNIKVKLTSGHLKGERKSDKGKLRETVKIERNREESGSWRGEM